MPVDIDHLMLNHDLPGPFAKAIYSFAGTVEHHYPELDLDWCHLAAVIYRALADYNREEDPSEYRRVYNAAAHSLKNEITLIIERLSEDEVG